MAGVEKCVKCSMHYQGFHICLDKPEHVMKRVVAPKRKATGQELKNLGGRWEGYAETRKTQDQQIVDLYNEGDLGFRAVAAEFGVSGDLVLRALTQAARRGECVIRKRGVTTPAKKRERLEDADV